MAFVVVDAYQGQGNRSALLRHLIAIAREAGSKELASVPPREFQLMILLSSEVQGTGHCRGRSKRRYSIAITECRGAIDDNHPDGLHSCIRSFP
jgi:GNAT superfamily N-acetyltransferase